MKSLGDLPAGVELYKIISIRFYKKKQFLVIFTYIRNVSNSFRNKIKKMWSIVIMVAYFVAIAVAIFDFYATRYHHV